jgi:putative oxidoreductase
MNPATRDLAALIGRVLLAIIFVQSGWSKIGGYEGVAQYIASKGLPLADILALAAIVIEFGGGLLIVIGWKARWAAAAMVVFLLVITPLFHKYWGPDVPPAQVQSQKINFQKNLSILGGMLLLVAFGPGRISIGKNE